MEAASNNETLTYRYDRQRAAFHGICEAGWVTFGLLIIIRGYGSSEPEWLTTLTKNLVAAAGFIGLLLTTATTSLISRSKIRATSAVSIYLVIAGVLLAASSAFSSLIGFVSLFVLANIIFSQQSPLMTETYAVNYPSKVRGQRVSAILAIAAISSLVFSIIGGQILDSNFSSYPLIILIMAVACWINAYLSRRIPSQQVQPNNDNHPFGKLSLCWKDKLFGWILSSKMLMGLANLMTLPIRIEILANPQYGINATNAEIVLASVAIPSAVRILTTNMFGYLFDRWNYIHLRMLINVCFIVGISLYFMSSSLLWIYIGAAFVGLGMGGGGVSWNLWITKIAPPEKTASYMSVHTSLTGVRGIAAPFLAYSIVHASSPQTLAITCVCLILISTVMYLFLNRNERLDIRSSLKTP